MKCGWVHLDNMTELISLVLLRNKLTKRILSECEIRVIVTNFRTSVGDWSYFAIRDVLFFRLHWYLDRITHGISKFTFYMNIVIFYFNLTGFAPNGAVNNVPSIIQIIIRHRSCASHYFNQSFPIVRIYTLLSFHELILEVAWFGGTLCNLCTLSDISYNGHSRMMSILTHWGRVTAS